ncbi:hypothetical protein OUZ56_020856 [Daphnia magna]|uniref:Uncharacterized protein n=1 Tax=Daphnia magna TaxID=35525 RepID=A0ABQ9ZFN0_9CRUS|nr:hypothetical protein OUZ56_020856 [Daphnia magna]
MIRCQYTIKITLENVDIFYVSNLGQLQQFFNEMEHFGAFKRRQTQERTICLLMSIYRLCLLTWTVFYSFTERSPTPLPFSHVAFSNFPAVRTISILD